MGVGTEEGGWETGKAVVGVEEKALAVKGTVVGGREARAISGRGEVREGEAGSGPTMVSLGLYPERPGELGGWPCSQ